MNIILFSGLLFWMGAAFFGTRRSYLIETGPFYALFRSIKSRSSLLLLIGALLLIVIAMTFCSMEIEAIQNKQGVIGIYFMVSVFVGVTGASAFSAWLFIDSD